MVNKQKWDFVDLSGYWVAIQIVEGTFGGFYCGPNQCHRNQAMAVQFETEAQARLTILKEGGEDARVWVVVCDNNPIGVFSDVERAHSFKRAVLEDRERQTAVQVCTPLVLDDRRVV